MPMTKISFHQWLINGDLSMDVEVIESDGTINIRRIVISQDRLVRMIADDEDGVRFFMYKVLDKIRPKLNMDLTSIRKVMKVPSIAQEIMVPQNRKSSNDILGPQMQELEESTIGIPEVPGYLFAVVV